MLYVSSNFACALPLATMCIIPLVTYLTESLIVKGGSILTAEITEGEALVGLTVLDEDVRFTDLDLAKCDWIGSFWFAGGRVIWRKREREEMIWWRERERGDMVEEGEREEMIWYRREEGER